ncbi:MAG: 30S ribosomal protein S6 [Chloroflexi bacterium]|nr:30S ribosomal protein S6 [Chloroflexota bacterium]
MATRVEVSGLRNYELVAVLKPDMDDERVGAALERVKSFVSDRGGSVDGEELWGRRKLAYPIQKQNEGIYFLTRFTLEPPHAKELERSLNLSEEVMRHLIVRLDT